MAIAVATAAEDHSLLGTTTIRWSEDAGAALDSAGFDSAAQS